MGLSRRHFLTSTALLGAAAVTGCASKVGGVPSADPADLSRVAAVPDVPDTVTVVVVAFDPYTVQDGDDLSGPVPDVARRVLTGLGVSEVEFVVVDDEQKLVTMAAAQQLEMAGGLTVRPDLCTGLRFSRPDYVSGSAFAVPTGNPKGITTFADVVAMGAKVAVWQGLPWEADAVQAGVPDGDLVRRTDLFSLLAAVKDGEADCFPFDDLSLRALLENEDGALEATTPFLPAGRLPLVGAYAFPEDSPLVEPFNDALTELHTSGEWLAVVEPFGLTEDHEPPTDVTTEKACAG